MTTEELWTTTEELWTTFGHLARSSLERDATLDRLEESLRDLEGLLAEAGLIEPTTPERHLRVVT